MQIRIINRRVEVSSKFQGRKWFLITSYDGIYSSIDRAKWFDSPFPQEVHARNVMEVLMSDRNRMSGINFDSYLDISDISFALGRKISLMDIGIKNKCNLWLCLECYVHHLLYQQKRKCPFHLKQPCGNNKVHVQFI